MKLEDKVRKRLNLCFSLSHGLFDIIHSDHALRDVEAKHCVIFWYGYDQLATALFRSSDQPYTYS